MTGSLAWTIRQVSKSFFLGFVMPKVHTAQCTIWTRTLSGSTISFGLECIIPSFVHVYEARMLRPCVGPSLVQKNHKKCNKNTKQYKNNIKIMQKYRKILYCCIIFISFLYFLYVLLYFCLFFCTRDGPTQLRPSFASGHLPVSIACGLNTSKSPD